MSENPDLKLIIGDNKPKRSEEELYKKMYYYLFNAITDALNETDKASADAILIQAQIDAEEIYISQNF